jgi:succinate dehydrogenase / fumarate reductase membrane anchor subunit
MSETRNPGAKSIKAWKSSARHGAGEWLVERFSSLALLPLTAYGLYAATQLANSPLETKLAFVKAPHNAAIIGLFIIIAVWHAHLGLGVVIDDYYPKGGLRGPLVFLKVILSLALLVGGIGALYLIVTGA